jgi:hypothetical protein
MFTMKQRQYRSRQGRSDEKYEKDAKLLFYTVVIGVAGIALVILLQFLNGLF